MKPSIRLTFDDVPFRTEEYEEQHGDARSVCRAVVQALGKKPFEINNGLCAEFARQFVNLLGGSVWSTGVDSKFRHDFVEWHGRFYDAEAHLGAECWFDLPVFVRQLDRTLHNLTVIAEAEHHGTAWKKKL